MESTKSKYGTCEKCKSPFQPVYFIDEELDSVYFQPTGRTRISVDYLLCDTCGDTIIVDNSFDGPWM
jgi:hypothetical protein